MRIFFCGAPGVGKSTLVFKLKEHFPFLTVFDSMSALFMKKKDEQFTSQTFQNKVNVYCFNVFLNSEDNIVMSRSIIDSLALNSNPRDLSYIEGLIPDSIRKNDFFFYLPIEFLISEREDGLRETDIEYQKLIDYRIKQAFDRFPSENKFIITGDIDERVNKILSILENERTSISK